MRISMEQRPLVGQSLLSRSDTHSRLYRFTVHLDINVYVHRLMHLFFSPREH